MRAVTTGTLAPAVAMPVAPAFARALTFAVAPPVILVLILALAFTPVFTLALTFALAIVVLVDMAAIEPVAGIALPLLLAPSPASIVADVDIVACQGIVGAYLRSEVGQHTSDAYEKRRAGGGFPGFAYRHAEGGACYVRRLGERGVVAVRRPLSSGRGLGTPLK